MRSLARHEAARVDADLKDALLAKAFTRGARKDICSKEERWRLVAYPVCTGFRFTSFRTEGANAGLEKPTVASALAALLGAGLSGDATLGGVVPGCEHASASDSAGARKRRAIAAVPVLAGAIAARVPRALSWNVRAMVSHLLLAALGDEGGRIALSLMASSGAAVSGAKARLESIARRYDLERDAACATYRAACVAAASCAECRGESWQPRVAPAERSGLAAVVGGSGDGGPSKAWVKSGDYLAAPELSGSTAELLSQLLRADQSAASAEAAAPPLSAQWRALDADAAALLHRVATEHGLACPGLALAAAPACHCSHCRSLADRTHAARRVSDADGLPPRAPARGWTPRSMHLVEAVALLGMRRPPPALLWLLAQERELESAELGGATKTDRADDDNSDDSDDDREVWLSARSTSALDETAAALEDTLCAVAGACTGDVGLLLGWPPLPHVALEATADGAHALATGEQSSDVRKTSRQTKDHLASGQLAADGRECHKAWRMGRWFGSLTFDARGNPARPRACDGAGRRLAAALGLDAAPAMRLSVWGAEHDATNPCDANGEAVVALLPLMRPRLTGDSHQLAHARGVYGGLTGGRGGDGELKVVAGLHLLGALPCRSLRAVLAPATPVTPAAGSQTALEAWLCRCVDAAVARVFRAERGNPAALEVGRALVRAACARDPDALDALPGIADAPAAHALALRGFVAGRVDAPAPRELLGDLCQAAGVPRSFAAAPALLVEASRGSLTAFLSLSFKCILGADEPAPDRRAIVNAVNGVYADTRGGRRAASHGEVVDKNGGGGSGGDSDGGGDDAGAASGGCSLGHDLEQLVVSVAEDAAERLARAHDPNDAPGLEMNDEGDGEESSRCDGKEVAEPWVVALKDRASVPRNRMKAATAAAAAADSTAGGGGGATAEPAADPAPAQAPSLASQLRHFSVRALGANIASVFPHDDAEVAEGGDGSVRGPQRMSVCAERDEGEDRLRTALDKSFYNLSKRRQRHYCERYRACLELADDLHSLAALCAAEPTRMSTSMCARLSEFLGRAGLRAANAIPPSRRHGDQAEAWADSSEAAVGTAAARSRAVREQLKRSNPPAWHALQLLVASIRFVAGEGGGGISLAAALWDPTEGESVTGQRFASACQSLMAARPVSDPPEQKTKKKKAWVARRDQAAYAEVRARACVGCPMRAALPSALCGTNPQCDISAIPPAFPSLHRGGLRPCRQFICISLRARRRCCPARPSSGGNEAVGVKGEPWRRRGAADRANFDAAMHAGPRAQRQPLFPVRRPTRGDGGAAPPLRCQRCAQSGDGRRLVAHRAHPRP